MECVLLDATVISPPSKSGHRYILSAIDSFTRYPWMRAVHQLNAKAVADFFVQDILSIFGAPKLLKTDLEPIMTSKLMQSLQQAYHVQTTSKIPHNPQSRSQVESLHYFAQTYLAKFITETNRTDWNSAIPYFLLAYRTMPHTTTNIAPHSLMFGRDINYPPDYAAFDLAQTAQNRMSQDYRDYMQQLSEQARIQSDWARERYQRRPAVQHPQNYPVNRPPRLAPGTAAWWKKPVKVRDKEKLQSYWIPVTIQQCLPGSHITYIVRTTNGRLHYAHIRDLGAR